MGIHPVATLIALANPDFLKDQTHVASCTYGLCGNGCQWNCAFSGRADCMLSNKSVFVWTVLLIMQGDIRFFTSKKWM